MFRYASISAPLGAAGEVGIRVYNTHASRKLPSTDAYALSTSQVQIVAQTA